MRPKESRAVTVRFTAPAEPRDYRLTLDLFAEEVTWFESIGSVATRPPSVQHSASA